MQMSDLTLPELALHPLTLDPDRHVRGTPPASSGPLEDRVLLGGPFVIPMTAERHPEYRAFIEAEAPHSVYHELHMALSFENQRGESRLDTATVGLTMTAPAPAVAPVAWSMLPSRLDGPASSDVKVELKPQLKLAGAELSALSMSGTIGPAATPFLLARRELRSDPSWELRRTRTQSLDGSQVRLVMVVRAPRHAVSTLTLTVRASTKTTVLRRYRALAAPISLAANL
jgi:hypothetical protein